ncbi:hypothetical protein Ciccas_007215 [Cichlidogyrus casuarinus]|uniref:Uncharacterized protein n=1 Tax=Cichlidogyrus casuarinus TaxID=1844966 RepID=A0ABD2Q3M2_9PLAT
MTSGAIQPNLKNSSLLELTNIASSYPIFITDALFSSVKVAPVRCFLDEYFCVSLDSSVHVWRQNYGSSLQKRTTKQLNLPSNENSSIMLFCLCTTDSSRHANLDSSKPIIGAVSVCASGALRYWPKLYSSNCDTNYVDLNIWKSCHNPIYSSTVDQPEILIPGPRVGSVLLITKMANVFLIDLHCHLKISQLSPDSIKATFRERILETRSKMMNTNYSPQCARMTNSPGFLSNFSRRMSSIFAANPTASNCLQLNLRGPSVDNLLDVTLIANPFDSSSSLLVLLTDKYLDIWIIDKETLIEAHISSTPITILLQSTPLRSVPSNLYRFLNFSILPSGNENLRIAVLIGVATTASQHPANILDNLTDSFEIYLKSTDNPVHEYTVPIDVNGEDFICEFDFEDLVLGKEAATFLTLHPSASKLYPSLLGALCITGTVLIFEILTGTIIGSVDFPLSSELLSVCSLGAAQSQDSPGWGLFTLFSRHHGIFGLQPSEVAISAASQLEAEPTSPFKSFNQLDESLQSTVQFEKGSELTSLFEPLSKVVKVYCMGYKEQALKSLLTQLHTPLVQNSLLDNIPLILREWLHLAQEMMNDLPEHVKRPIMWESSLITPNGSWLKILTPLVQPLDIENPANAVDEYRFMAKLKGLHKLAELWLQTDLPAFVPLKHVFSLIGSVVSDAGSRRRTMLLENWNTTLHLDFDEAALAKDGLCLPEGLELGVSEEELKQAAEDDLQSAEGSQDRDASIAHSHLLTSILFGCELVVFMRSLHLASLRWASYFRLK